jgi:hypothetical protein
MNERLSQLSLDCLRLAGLPYPSLERVTLNEQLDTAHAPQRVLRELEELAEQGLVFYRVTAAAAWLTDAGWQVLDRTTLVK